LTAHSRYPHATPSPRLVAGRLLRQSGEDLHIFGSALVVAAKLVFGRRIPAFAAALYGPNGLKFVLNVATALLVLSLPLSVAQSAGMFATTERAPVAAAVTAISDDGAARASSASRGLLSGSRSPVTIAASDVPEVQRYAIQKGDTLSAIAQHYAIAADDLAYANGIDDEGDILSVGTELIIPPGRGALYFVKDGDTVASVAAKFKVEQSVIMTYNRLYFEPEHFATQQLIFVPGAEVPAMKRVTATRQIPIPSAGQLPARTGQLSWPVRGVLTQYYWWGHTGVDLAAPYGTGIAASDDGVVVATGWVAVGGLRVCVQHAGGLQTCYYHTSAVYVTPGEVVTRGQLIAAIGMTGVTTGPHVHWEVKLNGVAVNPLAY
jgi:murein DD-endopeptidase MepM/ murein hydrolase activator NlpD